MIEGGRGRLRVSRRGFLVGAAAVAAELVITACGPDDAAVSKPPPRTAPLRSEVVPEPAIAAKQGLETLVSTVPPYVRSGPTDQPWVAITVDDVFGIAGVNDLAALLDVLRSRSVQLTFFPTGGALEQHLNAGREDVWRRVISDGHEIGNHGYTHREFTALSDQELRAELTNTQRMLDRVLGPDIQYRMRLARPPGGAGGLGGGDPRIMAVLADLGYSMVMWTIDSNNTGADNPFPYKIINNATNGSIVLLHFTTFPVANYPGMIDRLRNERHLEPTNISGLFA